MSNFAQHIFLLNSTTRFFFFFNSVLRPFQDYFSSYETGQSVGGQKRENPEKNHLAHPQAELGLSHMWPVRGSEIFLKTGIICMNHFETGCLKKRP